MKKRIMVWILLFIMCFSVITFVGCNVDNSANNTTGSGKEVCGTPSIIKTMVAKVVEAQGGGIRVSGLSDGFSDEYTFEAAHTVVYGKETVSAPAKLSAGDTVLIEYTGNILKIYPGKIEDVLCVVILDDIDSPESEKTLIAEVTATDENGNISVRGLSDRLSSEYVFSSVGASVYAYNNKDTAAEISKGDLIMVKFSGLIEETYPGRPSGVTDVIKLAQSVPSSGTGKTSDAKKDIQPISVEYKATVSYVGWTENTLIASGALNGGKASESGSKHFPIFKADTKKDLEDFKSTYGSMLSMNQKYDEIPSFNKATEGYDDAFFENNSLLMIYVTSGSGSLRYGVSGVSIENGELCVHVKLTNNPEIGTCDMAGWLIAVEIEDGTVRSCISFDADFVNPK